MIILDGINNLPPNDQDLHWLPIELPPKVNVVLSSSHETKFVHVVKTRYGGMEERWIHIPVQPLDSQERKTILKAQLLLHGRISIEEVGYTIKLIL